MSEITARDRSLKCPECGAPMELRRTNKYHWKNGKGRLFYGCTRWPECKATHGAHPDGSPLGVPANGETKAARIEAHVAFDGLIVARGWGLSGAHIIATVRSKQDYVQQKDEKTGKTEIKKVGLAPVQREGLEYEFTVFFDLSTEHVASASKDRTSLFDSRYIKPTPELGKELLAWLNSGADVPAPGPPVEEKAPAAEKAAPKPVNGLPGEDPSKATAPKQGEQPFPVEMISEAQKKKMLAGFNDLGITNRDTRLSWVRTCLHAPGINSVKDLTKDQASKVIDALESALSNMRAQKASA